MMATEQDIMEEYEAPQIFKELYPYYLAGYDYQKRPIWIAEIGRWNFRKMIETAREGEGNDLLKSFERFVDEGFQRMIKSMEDRSRGAMVIFDFDGYSLYQMTHVPTTLYLTRLARHYVSQIGDLVKVIILLNANSVTQFLVNVMRPIVGGLMERVQIFGKNRSKWLPHLLRQCPLNQLPPCYGGTEDFCPVKVYGLDQDALVHPPVLLNRPSKND